MINITIIGLDREGARGPFLRDALNNTGQVLATLVDSHTIADRFTGEEYLAVVNKSEPIPLSRIDECRDAQVIIIIHHPLHYRLDYGKVFYTIKTWHPNLSQDFSKGYLRLDRNQHAGPLIVFWHAEPYFSPSIVPDLLLAPDTNIVGHWLQWWRNDFCKITRSTLFPFACPDLSSFFKSIIPVEKTYPGLNFLANLDFSNPQSGQCSYFERIALRDRIRLVRELEHSGHLFVHPYPLNPWRTYIELVMRCEYMLIIHGAGCQFNQQFSECLSAGTVPVVYIEEKEQEEAYARMGLIASEHYLTLGQYIAGKRIPPSKGFVWSKLNDYESRARQLLDEIETTLETKKNVKRLAAATQSSPLCPAQECRDG